MWTSILCSTMLVHVHVQCTCMILYIQCSPERYCHSSIMVIRNTRNCNVSLFSSSVTLNLKLGGASVGESSSATKSTSSEGPCLSRSMTQPEARMDSHVTEHLDEDGSEKVGEEDEGGINRGRTLTGGATTSSQSVGGASRGATSETVGGASGGGRNGSVDGFAKPKAPLSKQ